jgi:hypothetical protein
LVFVNNLLINEANPESNESVVSQHSGIFRMRKGSTVQRDIAKISFIRNLCKCMNPYRIILCTCENVIS